MKNLSCFLDTITIDGTRYEIICLPEITDGKLLHSFYIRPASHEYGLHEMFSLYADQHRNLEEAFEIAKANAPDYIDEFC